MSWSPQQAKPNVAVAHGGFVALHFVQTDAFGDAVAAGELCGEAVGGVTGRVWLYSKGFVGVGCTLMVDGVEGIGGAGGELDFDGWHFLGCEEHRGAIGLEFPRHDVEKALGELEGATCGVQESFPGLGFRLHALLSLIHI